MKTNTITYLKPLVFCACLLPLAWAGLQIAQGLLVNPIDYLTRFLGLWGLRFLCITLAITPFRRLIGWNEPLRWRRMLGLYAFFYVCLHLTAYLWLDQFFELASIWRDLLKRPFITLGMLAFVLLLPLAITSSNAMQRRLKRNWGRLHKLVYVIAPLAALHYALLVKKDLTDPLLYAIIIGLLLGLRGWWRWQARTALR